MASNKGGQNRQKKKENFLRQFRDEQSKELKQLTAAQFIEIWSHYDTDGKHAGLARERSLKLFLAGLGNGYIEGHELDDLLRELASSVNTNDAGPEVSPPFLFESRIRHASLL